MTSTRTCWSNSDLYAFSGGTFGPRATWQSIPKKVPRGKIVAKKKKCGAHLQSRLKTYHDGVGQVAVGLRLQPHGVELG